MRMFDILQNRVILVVKRLTIHFLSIECVLLMPTLQDVADRAGVSAATVSKVLSNTPYVSEDTRAKVLLAVQEIGYRPNLAARALSSGKTNIIAVVFPYVYDAIFKDPLVMSILEGIEAVFTENHYNLLLSTPRFKGTEIEEHYSRLLQSGYIEGLIAIDTVEQLSFAAEAEKWHIPTVVLGYHKGDFVVHSDNRLGGELMMSYIVEKGHEKIAILSVPNEMNLAIAERVKGLRYIASRAGLDFDSFPIKYSDFSSKGGEIATRELLYMHPELTAIISLNDRMAIGAIQAIQKTGLRVPEDISVIGYDNIPIALTAHPSLSTIDQYPVELGRQAALLMFSRLSGAQPSTVVIPPSLVERASVAQR